MTRTLTVVIPVYNEEGWILGTIADVVSAARRTPDLDADIVVVDDGSIDRTVGVVMESPDAGVPVRVVAQRNAGRHAARRRGLDAATGELVLFLDSRVSILPESLVFIANRLEQDSDDDVWNAHVVIETRGNPYGLFWNVLTEIAFAEYFSNPRTTSFGIDRFESFPKGTTCFLAPREMLIDTFGEHQSYYKDPRHANDDTPMIRRIAERHTIGISPEFACVYRPRERFRPFLKHAFHRGIVFLDGHGRRGARLLPAVVAFYPISLLLLIAVVIRPWVGPAALAVLVAGAACLAVAKRRSRSEIAWFAVLAPVYGIAHGFGMWRGLGLAATKRFRSA